MIRRLVPLVCFCAVSAGGNAYAAAGDGDVARGKIVANVRCGPCHFLNRHLRKVGPGLADIYGRAPGISGVPFRRWDSAALEQWLAGPGKVKPNTRMSIPPLSPRDRRDVIAYLASRRK